MSTLERRTELLEAVGQTLYGAKWHLPLARRYGFDPRTLRRWVHRQEVMSTEKVAKLAARVSGDVERLKKFLDQLDALLAEEGMEDTDR